jgi:DNA-binding LacI/PurR family transcriptional regulator
MREAGAPCRARSSCTGLHRASGYQAASAMLELSPRPTALFVGNDVMAVGALGALREAGVRVPKDLAVAASTTSRSRAT